MMIGKKSWRQSKRRRKKSITGRKQRRKGSETFTSLAVLAGERVVGEKLADERLICVDIGDERLLHSLDSDHYDTYPCRYVRMSIPTRADMRSKRSGSNTRVTNSSRIGWVSFIRT